MRVSRASLALALGASAMFANMYSTQAILPEIGRDLGVGAAAAGLSISVVVLGVAAGGWVHGPVSDRVGRARVMTASAALIVPATALIAVAPGLEALLALRLVQGLLMPGLLVVAVPYVSERFGARSGVAMGAYTGSLVAGGLVGRVTPALLEGALGWRGAVASLCLPAAAGAFLLWRWLPRDRPLRGGASLRATVAAHLRNRPLILNALAAGSAFFAFAGLFTYAGYRLTGAPFRLGVAETGLVYGVWIVGLAAPFAGRAAQRLGAPRLLPWLLTLAGGGAALTLVDTLAAVILGLAAVALAMFCTVTACQFLIPRLAGEGRGAATSLHLTIYYALGSLGAWAPGLVLDGGWSRVVAACAAAVVAGFAAALALRRAVPPEAA